VWRNGLRSLKGGTGRLQPSHGWPRLTYSGDPKTVGGSRPTEKETGTWGAKETGNRSTTVACNLQRAWFTNSATFGKHLRGRETCLDGNYVKRFKAEHDQFVDSRWVWVWVLGLDPLDRDGARDGVWGPPLMGHCDAVCHTFLISGIYVRPRTIDCWFFWIETHTAKNKPHYHINVFSYLLFTFNVISWIWLHINIKYLHI